MEELSVKSSGPAPANQPAKTEPSWTARMNGAARWPNEKKLAIWVVINVEWFAFDGGGMALFESTKHLRPDVLNYAWRNYGLRVGLSRLVSALKDRDIPATIALNSAVCDYAPPAIDLLGQLRCDYMGHGITNSTRLSDLTDDEEMRVLSEVKETIRHATGQDPAGWLGPGAVEKFGTLHALSKAGYKYLCDWCDDDLPYRFFTNSGVLWAAPYSMEINDGVVFHEQKLEPKAFYRRIMAQGHGLLKESGPRAMAIALHPFLIGQPFRLPSLLQALDEFLEHRDTWFCTGVELINAFEGMILNEQADKS